MAKQRITVKVGGKRPRGRPRLRWMDKQSITVKVGGKRPNSEGGRKAQTEVDGQTENNSEGGREETWPNREEGPRKD